MRTTIVVAIVSSLICVSACTRSPEERAARFMESGKRHMQARDYARAVLQFQNAVKATPRDAEPFYQLALAYEATGDLRAAVVNLRKATEVNPKHIGAQLKISELMATRGTDELKLEASHRVKTVLSSAPDNAEALRVMALVEVALGNPVEAENYLNQALDKYPRDLQASVLLARVKIEQRDMKEAERILRQAAERSPGKADPHVFLGTFYFLQNRIPEAEASFRQALQYDSHSAAALGGLANVADQQGRKEDAERILRQLSETGGEQYRTVYGSYLIRNSRYDAAIAELEKQAKADPADRSVRTNLIAAYIAAKRLQDVERILAEALKRNPKDVDARLQRSRLYLAQGKYTDADADVKEAMRYRPESGEARYLLGALYNVRGESLRARQEFGEALQRSPGLLEARIELARILLRDNNGGTALDILEQAPPNQKKQLVFLIERNWALISANKEAEVSANIAEILKAVRPPEVLLQDGLVRLHKHDYAGSRRSLEEALKGAPEDLRALDALATTYMLEKGAPQAIEIVMRHVSSYPQSAKLRQFAGQMLLAGGRRDDARREFAAAKAADNKFVAADLALAGMDLAEGKLDSAQARFTTLTQYPQTALNAEMALGDIEERNGDHAAAINHFRKAVDVNPHNPIALNNLAYVLTITDKLDEALKYAQQAKELAPNEPSYSDTLGWVLYRKGLYSTAIQYLEAGSAAGVSGKYHLAMGYMQTGDFNRAHSALLSALKVDSTAPEASIAQRLWEEKTKSPAVAGQNR